MMQNAPTRKIIIAVFVFLLLGAIVNVAVAWGCALYPPQATSNSITAWRAFASRGTDKGWAVVRRQRWGVSRHIALPGGKRYHYLLDHEVPGLYPAAADWPEILDARAREQASPSALMVDAVGWPCTALLSTWDGQYLKDAGAVADGAAGWHGAIALSPGGPGRRGTIVLDEERALPLSPIWPGFAINTLLYAAILWLLFAAPFALRRRRRIKRGLCPACAYPVGANAVCTECGKPLPSPSR